MKIFVVTTEDLWPNEEEALLLLSDHGVDKIHLRKPCASQEQIRELLHKIPCQVLPKIVLHDHFCLSEEFPVGGIHLNRRNPDPYPSFAGSVSASAHSLDQLRQQPLFNYMFLSPIFDSLSKIGYQSGFDPQTLLLGKKENLITDQTVALGGITPSTFPLLRLWGFGGAALLGYIWADRSLIGIRQKIKNIQTSL